MTGRLRVSALARRRRQTSMPDTLGSIQSSTTRSGWRSSISMSASSPSAATTTLMPLLVEIVFQQGGEGVLVFHHQHIGGHAASPSASGRVFDGRSSAAGRRRSPRRSPRNRSSRRHWWRGRRSRSRFLATNNSWAQAPIMRGSAHHVGKELAEQRVIMLIDLLVVSARRPGPASRSRSWYKRRAPVLSRPTTSLPMRSTERVTRVMGSASAMIEGALGDVLGLIAGALQVPGQFHARPPCGAGPGPPAGAGRSCGFAFFSIST